MALRFLLVMALGAAVAVAAPDVDSGTTPATRIVFETNRAQAGDVWSSAPDGTQQRNLTRGSKAEDLSPALSPDGRRIAFVRVQGDRSALWIMGADGSNPRRLGTSLGSELHPAWSPSGTHIAFVTLAHGVWDVAVASLDGTRRRLTNDAAAQYNVTWTREGDRIVYDRIEKQTSDLWSVSVDGGAQTRITKTPEVAELNPAYSPVADAIAYGAADAKRVYDLYVLDVETGRARRVTNDVNDDGDPAWSPDGTQLAYRREVGADYEIARVSAVRAGRPFNVSRNPSALDLSPSWQVAPSAPAAAPARVPSVVAPAWIFACDKKWPGKNIPETLIGDGNVNYMCGDGMADTIEGRAKGDFLSGGTAKDVLKGEDGVDWLKARDSTRDTLNGGSGYDHGLIDATDGLTSVEAPES